MKIGVLSATYNRPHNIRSLVLQMQNQIRKPDLLVIHHNGNKESYEWVISDIKVSFEIKWVHTPEKLTSDEWFSIPLKVLIDEGCTHFFSTDDDDFYYSDFIEKSIETFEKEKVDFIINKNCDLIYLKKSGVVVVKNIRFDVHAPGGQSSSVCFNRQFACELLKDYDINKVTRKHEWNDQTLARETMPKFKVFMTDNLTTCYVSHESAASSSIWVKE